MRKLLGNGGIEVTHLREKLTHILGAGAACGLISHGGDPVHKPLTDEAVQSQKHQRNRAVAADVVFNSGLKALFNDRHIDGIENDHRIFFHSEA